MRRQRHKEHSCAFGIFNSSLKIFAFRGLIHELAVNTPLASMHLLLCRTGKLHFIPENWSGSETIRSYAFCGCITLYALGSWVRLQSAYVRAIIQSAETI